MKINHLAFVTIMITYALIVFGGYVATSNSGMGCGPEWPLCNGEVVPVLKGDTLIEFAHRVIGAILGLVAILLFIKILRAEVDTTTRSVAWGMISLLIGQVLLGAVVVVLDLPVTVVSIHLLIAMVFLACVIWIWRKFSLEETGYAIHSYHSTVNEGKRKTIVFHLNVIILLLFLTLAFGAYIKHENYGLACGWLDCQSSFFPVTIPEILQTIHRSLAVASAIYILLLMFWAFSKKWGVPIQRRFMVMAMIVFVQMLIGLVTVGTLIDIPWAVLHLAVGTVLFAFVYEARVYIGLDKASMQIQGFLNENKQFDR
ncbi:COX15/CtaA family protein [Bacillus sp. FJAT-29790]|uniref:COX15/CtaA family protein n=1 Tax=Bacillus sp. FJAT-29790 TaxID=1895002 RepID=UPI001C230198|nr:COX15/CtaA family protein [Bacillus sp. FJAT-29790]MBU8877540.1 COX15/CtaA family protein [Bacillus sp. FJAT-29790]